MANKRSRTETTEQLHTRHKKLKTDHGESRRVDPDRYEPYLIALPSDGEEDDDDKHNALSRSTSNEAMNGSEDNEFGLLLYELASLDVSSNNAHHNGSNSNHNSFNSSNASNDAQTCPICSARVSLKAFPDHVHGCLDRMDSGDRNTLKSQVDIDSDFATTYALKHGYVREYGVACPICGKQLLVGTGMNEHVNQCADASERKGDDSDEDSDEDDDLGIGGEGKKAKVDVMSREQMITCAGKLMTLPQGSEQFDNMLDMFGALGFNKQNVKSVLEIEKKQKMIGSNANQQDDDDDDDLQIDDQDL